MSTAGKWFAVKTLCRSAAEGAPLGRDKYFAKSATVVEERVVVFKARSFAGAIRKAEAEAKAYARERRHRNSYGQPVRTRYLGWYDVYLMDDGPNEGTEVFSAMGAVPRRVSDRAIVRRALGAHESRRALESRRNVMDIVFSGSAPGVRLTRKEQAFVDRYGTLRRTDA